MARDKTLNPNSTLAMARKAAERLDDRRHSGYRQSDVDVLLDAFMSLDLHLSGGGDYPDDWDIDEGDDDDDDDDDDDEEGAEYEPVDDGDDDD